MSKAIFQSEESVMFLFWIYDKVLLKPYLGYGFLEESSGKQNKGEYWFLVFSSTT